MIHTVSWNTDFELKSKHKNIRGFKTQQQRVSSLYILELRIQYIFPFNSQKCQLVSITEHPKYYEWAEHASQSE